MKPGPNRSASILGQTRGGGNGNALRGSPSAMALLLGPKSDLPGAPARGMEQRAKMFGVKRGRKKAGPEGILLPAPLSLVDGFSR